MKIQFVEIANFRRLKSVRIDIDTDTTLLVGPNNSGKSSVVLALQRFLHEGTKFKLSDITLQNLPSIVEIGECWTTETEDNEPVKHSNRLHQFLPSIDVWIAADESELSKAPIAAPLLQDYNGGFGVRLRLEPSNPVMFREEYVSAYNTAKTLRGTEDSVHLRPTDLVHHLETQLARDFEIRGYLLNTELIEGSNPFAAPSPTPAFDGPKSPECPDPQMQLLGPDPISFPPGLVRTLIRIDTISATRGVSDADAEGTSDRLSGISTSFYERHLQNGRTMSMADVLVIKAEQTAIRENNTFAQGVFADTLEEIRTMGYPGGGDPGLIFESDLSFELPKRSMYLRHRIDVGMPTQRNLDESLNGLGYQSLIYMVFCLMNFRHARCQLPDDSRAGGQGPDAYAEDHPSGVAPIHLVLIEEPEAFLHAQVQQVFIKHAISVLRKSNNPADPAPLSSQLVVSTHSSHIVQEVPFKSIRYVRREAADARNSHPVSSVINLTAIFDKDDEITRFTKRYIELNHCNLFFADAIILVEGAAERMLLPDMMKGFESVRAAYVELLQVRGSHAHKLRPLIEILGVPTLIITDIDSMKPVPQEGTKKDGSAKADKKQKIMPKLGDEQSTGNFTLSNWLGQGEGLDDLAKLDGDRKIRETSGGGLVRFAYQAPLKNDKRVVPSTFEDALTFANMSIIRGLSDGPLINKYATIINSGKSTAEMAADFYDALQNADKGEFALNLLTGVPKNDTLSPPEYIGEALEWLDAELSRRGLFRPGSQVSVELDLEGVTNEG